ncbi:MAG: FAD-dependent monooxygenase, partial [Candidatus Eisenbacteria bacterium]
EEGSTNVFWPIAGRRVRWGFQLDPNDSSSEPVDSRLDSYLRKRAPWFLARPERIFWSTEIQFERRLARRFGQGRMWLLGDAAHLTSPVGVQSVNVGLREAHDLSVLLANIVLTQASLDSLETFEAARQAEWRRLLGLSGSPKVLDATTPWVAARFDRFASCIPASGAALDRLLAQIGLELPADAHESVDA